ncbi:MAG: hypothetical protein IME93_02495 [Proteobacteria bacterium]|nr:hypothetical protein [Pseudomonadota bacterium]
MIRSNEGKGLSNEALFLYPPVFHLPSTTTLPRYALKHTPGKHKQHQPGIDISDSDTAVDKGIRCRQCGHTITSPAHKLELQGQHIYCFRNPADVDFVIGCFQQAEGCRPSGGATTEHSWFQGYSWRIALCGQCGLHLGWCYTNNSGGSFFGLILDQLLLQ